MSQSQMTEDGRSFRVGKDDAVMVQHLLVAIDVPIGRAPLWDLARRRPLDRVLRPESDRTVLEQADVYCDVLLVAEPA